MTIGNLSAAIFIPHQQRTVAGSRVKHAFAGGASIASMATDSSPIPQMLENANVVTKYVEQQDADTTAIMLPWI
jgi:hypothetical protein